MCFLIGLIFTTGAGEYWLTVFDSFAGTIGLIVLALMEMIAVMYVYGHEKFTNDIYEMTGVKPGLYWQITWRFLAPGIMIVILVWSVVSMLIKHPEYSTWDAEQVILCFNCYVFRVRFCHRITVLQGMTVKTSYPGWVLGVAAVMVLAGILPIPIVFLLRRYQVLKMDINIHEGSIRRIDTTVSTKEMITDVDVSAFCVDNMYKTALLCINTANRHIPFCKLVQSRFNTRYSKSGAINQSRRSLHHGFQHAQKQIHYRRL